MWLVANNGDGFRRCKVPQPPPGARGCSHNNKLYSSSSAVWRRAYKTSCPLLGLFSYHIRRALPHSNIWLWQLPLQSTSAAARGDGALGGRYRICLCFEVVEMTEQGAKAKLFYNIVTNSCWESESNFDYVWVNWQNQAEALLLRRFKRVQNGP